MRGVPRIIGKCVECGKTALLHGEYDKCHACCSRFYHKKQKERKWAEVSRDSSYSNFKHGGVEMNLNELAKEITLKEGKKKSLPIGQVKEVMKLLLTELSKLSEDEQLKITARYERYQ